MATVVANGVTYDLGGADMVKRVFDPPLEPALKVSVVNPYRLPDRITTLSSGYAPMVENLAAMTKST